MRLSSRVCARGEGGEGGQFDDAEQALVAQHRQDDDRMRHRLAQARADADVVLGWLGDENRGAFQGALADQALTVSEILVEVLAFAVGVAAEQAQALVFFLVDEHHRVPDIEQRGDVGKKTVRKLGERLGGLKVAGKLGDVGLDPALVFHLPRLGLQYLDGTGEVAEFVRIVGVRHGFVEVAGR